MRKEKVKYKKRIHDLLKHKRNLQYWRLCNKLKMAQRMWDTAKHLIDDDTGMPVLKTSKRTAYWIPIEKATISLCNNFPYTTKNTFQWLIERSDMETRRRIGHNQTYIIHGIG